MRDVRRNLVAANRFLPAGQRAEVSAVLAAYRVLRAREHRGADAVVAAVRHLNGDTDTPPQEMDVSRVRKLLAALPFEGRERIRRLVADVGRAMILNLDGALSRTAYGEGVFGPMVRHVCALVTGEGCADVNELAGCVGVTAQLVTDLRDGALGPYGACDRRELEHAVMQRILAPVLGSFVLLARLGPHTRGWGARVAVAGAAIAMTESLSAVIGAPTPYRRPMRLTAAVLAAASPAHWSRMLERLRCSAEGAILSLLDTAPASGPSGFLAVDDPRSTSSPAGPLIVGAAFALTDALPPGPLTGELPESQVRRMMIADHLAFCALERLPLHDAEAMRALASDMQSTAVASMP